MSATDGNSGRDRSATGSEPVERFDAPLYLARFRAREALRSRRSDGSDYPGAVGPSMDGSQANGEEPLYLKRFRERTAEDPALRASKAEPLWRRANLSVQQALTEDNRNKEIAPPPAAARRLLNDVYLIRHGETQGYSTDSGLTPQGAWQSHSYGRTLARRVSQGETVVLRHAPTSRARETAEHIHRGLADGLVQYEKDVTVVAPMPMEEFRNFQFAAPGGLTDVTAAFREYHALLEAHERAAQGDRPQWLVEMDRFWRTQQGGGDPIQHWLTVPLLHFEPPSMTVRRFWAGIDRLSREFGGARLAIATHSGCIRAFAVSALGYDPGEPYNVEHVRVKLLGTPAAPGDDGDRGNGVTPPAGERGARHREAPAGERDALVAYRNRVQEVKVPDIARLPAWSIDDDWAGLARS